MKHHLPATLLLLALGGLSANGQTTVTSVTDDLIVGFRATGGENANENVEIDVGSVSQFYALSPNTNFVLANLNDALDEVFGGVSDPLVWDQRTDLLWGVVATTDSVDTFTAGGNTIQTSTLWAGRVESTAGVQSAGYNRGSSFSQSGISNTVSTLYSGAPGSLVNQPTIVSSSNAVVIPTATAGSWSQLYGTTSAAFGDFTKSKFDAGTNFTSVVGSFIVEDLYELQPGSGPGTYLGSIGLTSAGLLEFSNNAAFFGAASIPEPWTFAALMGAIVFIPVLLRSRRAKVGGRNLPVSPKRFAATAGPAG